MAHGFRGFRPAGSTAFRPTVEKKAHSRECVVGTICLAYCGCQVGVKVRVLRLNKLFKSILPHSVLFHPVKPHPVKIPPYLKSLLSYDFCSLLTHW